MNRVIGTKAGTRNGEGTVTRTASDESKGAGTVTSTAAGATNSAVAGKRTHVGATKSNGTDNNAGNSVSKDDALLQYVLRLGDNALILGQRLAEEMTHGPELEEELANANFALDYIGQARMFYAYAAELEGKGRDEDFYAFRRDGNEFRNLLLVEQPNGHFGDLIARQFLFESFYELQLNALTRCHDERLAAIAARAEKEIRYHLRHIDQWIIRLGDGTEESHQRIQRSLDDLWRFGGEAFDGDDIDDAFADYFNGPDLAALQSRWKERVASVLSEATLTMPEDAWMDGGGRAGRHTEHFGYLLAEMQFLQRAYPDARW
ncbi:MAG: phenylacetate-CoA oxygenase subunit PaaC [Woeseia sp.]|nr:phenylacetate-CoA oxygenase subunit PaaC [Woeseia sp.]MBT8097480.1 phenylacetate-CoA oxygenase subunit PaaC [Woeseia sp.]NNE60890.1 phenylacetate-CoA oxygenase subunit PaaC [Woeseia sp.]NNL53952.1 phenylacetate-CoA oxygenase subunit PaaC [Woeseia sp.]